MGGYEILLGVDFNEPALQTYAFNHKNSKTLHGDLSAPDTFDKIEELIGNNTIDVIPGGGGKYGEINFKSFEKEEIDERQIKP